MRKTIKDVSNYAGVSIATVSHVVNNTRYVSANTKQKVLDAIDKLNYSPDFWAKNLKTGIKHVIGFVVPDVSNNFFATLIDEVEHVIAKKKYNLIVANTNEQKSREIEHIHFLTSGLVGGLIVASTFDHFEQLNDYIPQKFPLVFIDRKPNYDTHDSVLISNYSAIYKGVENLIREGHQKIGCVTGLQQISTLTERLKAYKNALEDHGIRVDESLIQNVDITGKNIYPCLRELFCRDISAVVLLNNIVTFETFTFLSCNNIRPDRDIAIVGYCDDIWYDYLIQHIGIISQPIQEMGIAAGNQIMKRIEKPEMPVNNTILQATFNRRNRNII